ncbi:DsbA family protein [Sphingomonas sp. JC676]|uniref:DsbA family protein n=1 Tax=Sphingomonas sp. JC676 TaxID=2768065 RepID=UPI0016585C0A|nr:DsbA family protein [Sphingomonas sp. JC676]MBC9033231.1 DsbA family protein [Sphingomonas sp. JC676]
MIDKLLRNPLALAGAFVACALLGALLFALIQAALPGVAGDRARIETVVRNYILEHPEILPEAMTRLQERDTQRLQKAQDDAQKTVPQHLTALRTPYAGAWAGNPKGDVTIVAFMDYACGYCRASLPGIDELLAKDPNVRIVYREYAVLGEESIVAARWALAAAEQGKFRAFHDALYAAGPSAEGIAAAADKAGLDKAAAQKAIKSQAVEKEITANHQLGAKLVMTGTPSWVIGDQLLYGARDYAGLAEAVAAARKSK